MTLGLRQAVVDAIADAARAWAAECGELARGMLSSSLRVEFKEANRRNPVTAADHAVEERLRALVAERFPTHAVLGEEGTPGVSHSLPAILWVVDPIDGTANFASGLPFWAVSIGVLYRRVPVAAAIYTPAGPEGPAVYHARRGGGAFCDDRPLAVRANERPEPATIIAVPGSWPWLFRLDPPLRQGPGEPRVLGSIATEMALTAAGNFQWALFGGPKIWDAAAGVLLIQEAGGVVLQRQGKRWVPLERFALPPRPWFPRRQETPLERLARWRAPLLCANPVLADFLARHLHPRFLLLLRARLMLRRLQALQRKVLRWPTPTTTSKTNCAMSKRTPSAPPAAPKRSSAPSTP
ncbi:MAG: inositol monophosphatase [Chloroflexota bacterium]|nr:inositol monophosphatase [Dehalococcoidia bacterium]MDW8253547.1 inositol monophosphatase [Chloroflexota bacterium]